MSRLCATTVFALLVVCSVFSLASASDSASWVVYEGSEGPGKGKRIVLASGDEEYRSEETLPHLARILAKHHGFHCTVLFAVDPDDGTINPDVNNNIPGLEALENADLFVVFLRFRDLPDSQMKFVADYIESGKPIVGLRTATHAFQLKSSPTYARYTWNNKEGGFGKQVLGETWVSHHGKHGKESCRGILAKESSNSSILRGIKDGDIWGPTDVYGVHLPLPGDSQPLVLGQVLEGMQATDKPIDGPKNNPMMPIAWTKSYATSSGKTSRVFTTTMGASQDFASEGLRRLLVNACYWGLGMENSIPEKSKVDLVGDLNPTPFGFRGAKRGVKPEDWK